MAAIDRRVGFIFIGFLALLVVALLRATYLGVIKAPSLQQAAVSQQITNNPIPAPRGTITDRDGVELAISESADTVTADPFLTKNEAMADAQRIAPLLNRPVLPVLALLSRPHTGYVVLAQRLAPANAEKIMSMGINGISTVPTIKRVYPRGWEAAQVLGGINAAGDGDSGLEWYYNPQLLGTSGERRIVSDAKGQAISIGDVKPMHPGNTVKLTLDSALQNQVEEVLAGIGEQYSPKLATAIVMNPQTGAILALANWPRVNDNDPGAAPASADRDQALQFNYEPGSTFKAITVAGALQDGLVSPSTPFDIPPTLTAYGSVIHDAEDHGYETLTTAGILKYSSNIGADLIGQKLGPTRFNSWVHRFGLGSDTKVDLPGEDPGIILPPSKYSGTSMYNLPFGQGESVTPIQMAAAYAAIANGGILRPPHIVQSIGGKAQPLPRGRRIISATTAAELRGMLRGVLADGGTASGAGISGYDMAGKTGTANIAVDGKYSDSEYVASFVGMVPASDPQLLGLIVVDDPQGSIYGGSVAAPAFQKIVGWAVPYLGIAPNPAHVNTSDQEPPQP